MNVKLETDTPYIHNPDLPIWIITISGWGSSSKEKAYERMGIYKKIAEANTINIEFSSRLGTFQSYKNAPSVARQIEEHNEKTFAVYAEEIGADWRKKFNEDIQKLLPKEY